MEADDRRNVRGDEQKKDSPEREQREQSKKPHKQQYQEQQFKIQCELKQKKGKEERKITMK